MESLERAGKHAEGKPGANIDEMIADVSADALLALSLIGSYDPVRGER
jgi:hypothetical protein